MSDPIEKLAIVSGKSDAEKAVEYKKLMSEALSAVGLIMDQAQIDGFQCNFGMGKDFRGSNVIAALQVMKVY